MLKFKNSLVFKQLVVFSLIIIINIIGASSIFSWAQKNIKNEIEDRLMVQNKYFLNDLENEINRIQELQYNFFADKYLTLLNTKEEVLTNYERREALLLIQERIFAIKLSNKYIKNITVYMNAANININDKDVNITTELEKESILEIMKTEGENLHFYKDKVYIVATNYQLLDDNKIPSLVMLIELSKEGMIETLNQFKTNKQNGSIVLARNNKWYFEAFMGDLEKIIATKFREQQLNNSKGIHTIEIEGRKYFLVYSDSESLGIGLIQFYPYSDLFYSLQQAKIYFASLLIGFCIIMLVFSIYTNKLINKPLLKLHHAFACVEAGDLEIRIEHHKQDEFGYIYTRFNEMLVNLKELIKQVYEYKTLVQRSELKQLQAQINPHFLYNSFFTLSRKIKRGDTENAIIFTEQLGAYFKFITRNGVDEVACIDEVQHARSYAKIQSMRFIGRIEVDFEELPKKYEQILVPRLILQPIIENAFEYSLEDKEVGGLLKISFKEEKESLNIIVEDNGDSLSIEQIQGINYKLREDIITKEITGLVNIHRRLKIFFGHTSGLDFRRSDLGGLQVIAKIDIRGEK